MTSQLKTYFLPPNWDFAPGGLITLGSLIIDPKRPDRSLNVGAQVGIPPGEISRDRKEGWQRTGEWLKEQDIGAQTPQLSILELFLQIVAHANAVDNTESDEVYKCDVLETECFQPTERYIRRCLQNPMVTSYIRDNRYRLPVYMITGVKVAKGFRVTRRHRRGESASSSERTVFRASSDCVFAFQLSRMRLKKNGTVQERDYTQGALLHTDDTEILEEDELLDETWEVNEAWEFLTDIPDMVTHLAVDTESEVGCLVAAPTS